MRTLWWIGFVVLFLLSFSTGAVKLAEMHEEMVLFRGAGIPDAATILFGVIQLGGALALLPRKARRGAAGLLTATYVIANIVVWVNGLVAFGIGSLTFIALAATYARSPVPPE